VTTSGLTWEIARAGGFVAYGLLTASVSIGLVLSLKWRSPHWTRFITNELHRFVTLLALAFTAIHTLMVAIDPFIQFTPAEVLIPFVSHYRPLWIALGIVATDLLIAVYVSEWIRPHVGYAWWRRFHYLAFVVFALALVHGLSTGSDSRAPWAIGAYIASVVLVGALISVRALPGTGEESHPSIAVLTVGMVLVVGFWAWNGPLQPGWNAIANDARGSGSTTAPGQGQVPGAGSSGAPPASAVPSSAPAIAGQPFTDDISGQLVQSTDGSVTMTAILGSSGDQLTIRFPSGQGSRLAIDGATVSLLAPDGDTCAGDIRGLDDNQLVAACQGATSGSAWVLRLTLAGDGNGGISGSIEATPQ
jgi:DMSO/TMAO reductase YedYZ heme-binding membrane subunit